MRQKPWLFLSLVVGLITVTVYCMVCRRRTLTSCSACKIFWHVLQWEHDWTLIAIYIGYLLITLSPTDCVSPPGKHFISLSLSTCLNSFLTIFHPDPCILPVQISLPDQLVLLATFSLGPFLCLHHLLGSLYLHTFVLSIPYPPLNAT